MDRMLEGKSDVSQCKWEGVKMFNDCNVGTDEDITNKILNISDISKNGGNGCARDRAHH